MNETDSHFLNLSALPRRLAYPSRLESIYYAPGSQKDIFTSCGSFDFCFEFSSGRKIMHILYDSVGCHYFCPHVWIKTRDHAYEQPADHGSRDILVLSYPQQSEAFFRNYIIDSRDRYSFVMTPGIGFLRKELVVRMRHNTEIYRGDRMDCLAMNFLHETFFNSRSANPVTSDENYWGLLMRIAQYVDNNIGDGVNTESICKHFFISRRTLFRYWKRHFSSTPAAYISQKRIELASHLLLNTNLKLNEVSEQSGYSSQTYFCSAFHRIKKMTPLQFRQKFADIAKVE